MDKIVDISQIINTCNLNLCVPTYIGESLASILKKICTASSEGSSSGGCCYEFRNSNTVTFLKDGNIISAAATGIISSFDAGNLAPLFTTSIATPSTTPFLSFSLNQQAANKVFIGPASGPNAYPSFRLLTLSDMPFGVGDFIQNQFVTDQPANWRVTGHGQLGDYLQIDSAAKIGVNAYDGKLAIQSLILPSGPTESQAGESLRLTQLKFFTAVSAGVPPFMNTNAAPSSSYIYSPQGDHITIVAPGAFGTINVDSTYISQTKHSVWNMGGVHPLIFWGGDSDSVDDTQDFIRIRSNVPAGVGQLNQVTALSFANNRENGIAINPLGNRGDFANYARIGMEVIDFSQTLYKGDLVFQTVDGAVNSGYYTEYLRLKYDGRIIASAYKSGLAAPTTTGTKHMLTVDANGLVSHEAIGAGGVGSVTSVGLSMPSAFSVANSPITTAGTLVVTALGTNAQVIRGDGSLGGVPLSTLLPAIATNSIDNLNFGQTWNWNTLSSQAGLLLQTNSTIAASNTQTLLWVNMFGLNANSNQATYGAIFSNSHTGTGATNVGASFSASGGATNIAAQFINGSANFGVPGTSSGVLKISGSASGTVTIQPAVAAGTYTLTLPTDDGNVGQILKSDGSGVLSWTDSSLKTPISGLTPAIAANTINNGNYQQTWIWGNLVSGPGLDLSGGGAATSTGSRVLNVRMTTGNNIATFSTVISNVGINSGSNTGLFAIAQNSTVQNIAIWAQASGGSDNKAIYVDRGDVLLNDISGSLYLHNMSVVTSQDYLLGHSSSASGKVGKVGIGAGLTLSSGVLSAAASGGNIYNTDGTLTDILRSLDGNRGTLLLRNMGAFAIKGIDTYDDVTLFAASGDLGGVTMGDVNSFVNSTLISVYDSTQEIIISNTRANGTFFQIGGFGAASNGDVLTLISNVTGEVGWTAGGGGGGGVSTFSAGTLSPLFTTSVATATTTPALSFILTNAGAHTYFGNNTAGSAAPAYKSNAALTKVDDTNVTLTLGGAPTTSLLEAVSLTLGWTGTLGVARGGTNIASYTAGDLIRATGVTTLTKLAVGTANQLLRVNAGGTDIEWYTAAIGTGSVTDFSAGDLSPLFTTIEATTTSTPALSFVLTNATANTYFGNATGGSTSPSYTAAGALTAVNDTNVLLTVGGNSATSLLRAASITASWNGTLSIARGGTNLASYTIGDILIATGATTLSKLAIGSVGQQLRVNGGGTSLEYFTAGPGITTLNTLTAATQTFAVGTSGADFNIVSSVSTHTFNIPTAGVATRGLIGLTAQTLGDGIKTFNVGVVINESGAASDFRVESDTDANALFVDATNNRVGIFTAVPAFPFEVTGNTRIIGTVGIGTSPSTPVLTIGGTAGIDIGVYVGNTISTTVNSSPSLVSIQGGIIESTSGIHAIISALSVSPPNITAGAATVTNAATVYISGATTAVGATNSALLVNSGTSRFNGNVIASGDFILTTGNASTGAYDIIVRNQSTGRLEAIDGDSMGLVTYGTTSVTPILSDKGKYLTFTNAGAITFTVPTNILVPFPVGTTITLEQGNTGQITVVGGVGITINASDGALKSRTQYSVMTLVKKSSITWTLSGDATI